MRDTIQDAWRHPVTPLVLAAVATAIFVWGVYPETPVGASVMIVAAWAYNIVRSLRRRREQREPKPRRGCSGG